MKTVCCIFIDRALNSMVSAREGVCVRVCGDLALVIAVADDVESWTCTLCKLSREEEACDEGVPDDTDTATYCTSLLLR